MMTIVVGAIAVVADTCSNCEVTMVDLLVDDDALEIIDTLSRSTTFQIFSPSIEIFSLNAHNA